MLDLVVPAEGRPQSMTLVTRRPAESTLSDDLKERVVRLYSLGDEVATLLDVSLGFAHNAVSCYQKFGQTNDP